MTRPNSHTAAVLQCLLLTAFERGVKDCAAYYSEPGRGAPQKDNYPSNPYNKEGDYERWKDYNRGWNSNAF